MVRPARFRKIVKHLKNRGKVETIECAVAISLSLDKTLKAIECVKVLQNNKEIHVSADVFIVAMGALESPRILLQSFESVEEL